MDGAVQIKSYLGGNPPIKIKLNDDLVIGKRDNPYGAGPSDAGEHKQKCAGGAGGGRGRGRCAWNVAMNAFGLWRYSKGWPTLKFLFP